MNKRLIAEGIYNTMRNFYNETHGTNWKWDESIYFHTEEGYFLHNDYRIPAEIFQYLINKNLIKYTGITKHQGIMMPTYKVVDKTKEFRTTKKK